MGKTAIQRLYEEQGQAPWLDSISRGMLASGELQHLIEAVGIVGVTSNPTIFEKAVAAGADYDRQIHQLAGQGLPSQQIFFELMLHDIQEAADLLRPVYERTGHQDG